MADAGTKTDTADATMAALGRELADTLMRYAHDRRPDDQKAIAQLHTDLCAARRAEQQPAPPMEGS